MGAGAIVVCHNKAAVKLKEDMKKLMLLQQPLAKLKETNPGKVFGVSLLDLQLQGQTKDKIPSVVWHMVEYLKENGLMQEGLFRVNGNVKVVERLRLKFEQGEHVALVGNADVTSVASLLKLFLRELPDGVITSSLHQQLMNHYQGGCNQQDRIHAMKGALKQLPEPNYYLLKYLCHFLTEVSKFQNENKMTIYNLATVFGPNIFHVSLGIEGMKEQHICNKITMELLENYSVFFEEEKTDTGLKDKIRVIEVKAATLESPVPIISNDSSISMPEPLPRRKRVASVESPSPIISKDNHLDMPEPLPRRKRDSNHEPEQPLITVTESATEASQLLPRRKKLPKTKDESSVKRSLLLRPDISAAVPQSQVGLDAEHEYILEETDFSHKINLTPGIQDSAVSTQEEERPMSPFYLGAHVSPVSSLSTSEDCSFLEKTIRSAVEQHLFNVNNIGGQNSEDTESRTTPTSPVLSSRQRRRYLKEQEEAKRSKNMEDINKENIPSDEGKLTVQEVDKKLGDNGSGYLEERMKPKRHNPICRLSELSKNQDNVVEVITSSKIADNHSPDDREILSDDRNESEEDGDLLRFSLISKMKIQEKQSSQDTLKSQRIQDTSLLDENLFPEVPRLDLTGLTEDNLRDPVPAMPSWQRSNTDSDEACLSPQPGRLIRQLLEEDSDPMLSPRFYGYGHSQQYLDDTEVPPSPPNSHSFMRPRSSSLGSCEDDTEDLTPIQMTRKIQSLKKKIRKFEDKFEEERKYRPSHSDKAANGDVLKWLNELAKLRKQLKDNKLKKSEEDLAPQVRQRSNTLPKSFGSRLEREQEKQQEALEKAMKPATEATLESIQKKLQDKRTEMARPEDIKEMTRDQIAEEKVALQKALLYYESIHGRPVAKNARQLMRPMYDRYRLVKQLLARTTAIPIIGSPSSKRRSPLLQPIIEGETASFVKEKKEEEDGSEDDSKVNTDFAVTMKPGFSVRSFLDQIDDDADGFVSPVDDQMPSKINVDMGLSHLHSASMPELLEQLQDAREDKKRIRKKLREFEDKFLRQNGRTVQKEDRTPMAEEYIEYKQIKAKLKLLEVLIGKRSPSKTL
ncbi:protein FAM13A isoform X2 [Protopterus annectens]|uniref:protein FAM13A isoform X2 n=1 Tax=Protopterus annectens TaxID=7888 RepID=UPI001CFAC370|nr:protein FAM13A isoform X2 [Protopterus annectens]